MKGGKSGKKMAVWLFALSLFVFSFFEAQADIIAIIACDTHAHNIENSVSEDLATIRAEAAKIALYTESDLKEIIFDGNNLQPKEFLKTLKGLQFTEGDTVLFYFSGHGFRTYSKDESILWPNLFFSDSGQGIDFAQVLAILGTKKQSLLVAIADCCNNYMDDSAAPPLVKGGVAKQNIETLKKNYKKLFLDTKGSILVASSSVSEYSWCYPKGAVFTLALIQSMHEETLRKSDPDWKTVLDKASYRIKRHQTPFYFINTH